MSIAQKGRIITENHKINIKKSNKSSDPIVKQKISNSLTGHKQSPETIAKRSLSCSKPRGPYGKSKKCQSRPPLICPYCNKTGNGGSMKRYHFNNCKLNGWQQ